MRISISGTQNIGKTTLLKDMLSKWSLYSTPENTYRDILKEKNYPRNKSCNKEGQWAILNHMIDEMQKYTVSDNVIFDRSPLDCLIYSLWAYEKKSSDIDKAFIDKIIPLVKESLKYVDIIFLLPITKTSPVEIVEDGLRDIDPVYREEIDNLFKGIFYQYQHNIGRTVFLPVEDCPAIIEIFGNPEERIMLINQYLDENGAVYGEESDTILNPKNLMEMEELLKTQEETLYREQSVKEQQRLIEEHNKKTKKKS
jgi:predicted ATPase